MVFINETLLGNGTESNPLKVVTTKIATRNWSNQQFIDFDDNWGGTWFGHDTTYFRTYANLIGAPVISDTPYGPSWNGNMDGATKNTIWDILQTLGGLGTDLSLTRDANQAIVYSDTGNDVIVPAVTPTLAGLMTASDKTKLNSATKLDSIYAEPDPVFPIEYLKYSANSVTYDITEIPKPNGLITGGYVTWITGLNFVISPAAYYITGELYITGTESVTLSASDATYSRIDLIVVDTLNHVSVIEGVPGENPQKPTPDPVSQIEITQILILANATEPGNPGQITDELI